MFNLLFSVDNFSFRLQFLHDTDDATKAQIVWGSLTANIAKKDKKDDPSIVDTWQLHTATQIVKIDGTVDDNSSAPVTNYVFTFNSDNTFKKVDTDDAKNNTSGTYSVSGSTLSVTDADGTKETSTMEVSATELSMTTVDYYNYRVTNIAVYRYLPGDGTQVMQELAKHFSILQHRVAKLKNQGIKLENNMTIIPLRV